MLVFFKKIVEIKKESLKKGLLNSQNIKNKTLTLRKKTLPLHSKKRYAIDNNYASRH